MTKIFFTTTFTSLIVAGLNFLSGIMIARMLLPEERGLLGSIIFFVPIISFFFISGVQESSNYYISKYQKHKNILVKSAIVLSHKLGFLAFIFSFLFQAIYFKNLDLLVYIATLIFSIQAFVGLASTVMLECDLGNYDFSKYNRTRLFSYSLYLSGVVFLYLFELDKNWRLFWLVLLNLLLILSTYIYRIKSFFSIVKTTRSNKRLEKVLFFHGLKFHYSNLLSFLNKQIDKFIVMKFISLEMFGYYLVAWNFLYTISTLVSGTLTSMAMPYLRRSANLVKSSVKYITLSSLLTFCVVLIIGIVSHYTISILYSQNYKYSEVLVLYLILPVFVVLIKDLIYKVFKSNNMLKVPFIAEIIFIVVFGILMIFYQINDIEDFIIIFSLSLIVTTIYLYLNILKLKRKIDE